MPAAAPAQPEEGAVGGSEDAISTREPGGRLPVYDRAFLLSTEKRNQVLALWEVQQYGRDSYGDPDYTSIYGLKPEDWYKRGIRILARTAVECTRDDLADLMGRDIAAVARSMPAVAGSVVIDPFAGSGNTLFWIQHHVAASQGIGFELDNAVFKATRRNLSIVSLDVALLQRHYEAGLSTLSIAEDQLLIVFVAPPWGDTLSEASGLDLRRTQPPITEVIEVVSAKFGGHELLFAIQVYETVDPSSLEDVVARLDWWELRLYNINAPGRNHGVLLGTRTGRYR